ncbi:hypothetical protein HYW74_00735 [Candidatus Pacearchaeota archaeon]|nr:hypothetical protein [Candidatus Pacearchaeota archaeon]
MEKSLLIKFLGENPTFIIIDFLIENKGIDVTKKQIIGGAGISRASLFKCWKQLESQEIVLVTRKFGKTKLYKININNSIVKKLLELESVLIGKALDNSLVKKAESKKTKFIAVSAE